MAVRVVAPAVQVVVEGRVFHVFGGDLLPDGVASSDITRLVARGFVVDETEKPQARKPAAK